MVKSDSDVEDVEGVEGVEVSSTGEELTGPASSVPTHGFFVRLYTGTGAFNVVGKRNMWFAISGVIVAIAIVSMLMRGFTLGIDFEGGTRVSMPRGEASTQQVEEAFFKALGRAPESVVVVGNGAAATVQIRAETLSEPEIEKLRIELFDQFQPKGDNGAPNKQSISDSKVSETWGGQITQKALIALVVFLVLVTIYITLRYERYMAMAALAALGFDLTVTAGVYALVGFEVTPATVVGLLTILGFSLYDTVIVFDKVEENTHGFEHTTRRTFAEQANLAINQTFMRSINTSLISVLPVAALIVVAVWLLGVGTLKDLAIVQLVGILVGTYSSIFFATPLLVTMREHTDLVRGHTRRVLNRRRGASARASAEADAGTTELGAVATASLARTQPAPEKPAPGAKPIRPTGRPSGKRNTRR